MQRKTVVHVTSVHPRNDVRIFTKECVTLARAGYAVTLFVADGKGNGQCQGVTIVDVGCFARGGRLMRMTYTIYRLFQAVRSLGSCLVHFHDPELIIMALWLKKLGYRVIYDIHEDVPRQLLTKYWIPRWIRPTCSYLWIHLEHYAAKRFDALVVPTLHLQDRFRRIKNPTILLRNYPLLTELGKPVAWSKRKNEICYIGSISSIRGINILIEAIHQARVPLQLAGLWSEPMLHEQLVKKAGWCWVHELGVVNRQGIMNILMRVKVGVVTLLPTPNHLLALPIKLFEYMAVGLPVIVSDFPLWRSIVEQAQCGLLVDPSDAQAIAQAIRQLLDNPKMAKAMGDAGRQAVLKQYNWEMESHKLFALYDQLTGSVADS
ncbi:MAG: glycosyltransferase family 4 protein [Neisseriales bacterium]|nr:MAG: glycosyltransferase family 4 protein [Neisseriales bacterium]